MTIHSLLTPENSTVIFIDQQPQMTFGVASIIEFVYADSLNLGDEAREMAIANAQSALKAAIAH
ncbi:hypothetical protein QM565_33565 [Geitlerinema splendidum]|nr:hypothetical protein [Geitlerinema splendidum]